MKAKNGLLFFVAIIFSSYLFGQQPRSTLTGKIIDSATGQPLVAATVYFPDLRTGAASNNNGVYTMNNISQGTYLIEISHLGYLSVIEYVQINGNVQKDFALSPSFIENVGVTVTGVSRATSLKRTPIPVNLIKKEDLFRNVSTNLMDNLTKTPGVSQISTGPAISKPSIRGLGYNRVVVVYDGIRQEGQQWGDEHGIEIDELNVGRAEVMKGSASLMYGSDALAGVINIISIIPPPEGTVRANALLGYQTNNRQLNSHFDIGGNNKGFIWGLNASGKWAADYKNKFDGYVFNSKFNEKDFGGYVGLNKNWGFTHFYFSRFDQDLGIVEGDRDSATGSFLKLVNDNGIETEEIATDKDFKSKDPYVPKQRIQHGKIAVDNSFNIGKDRLTVALGWQRNQRQEFANVLDPREKGLYFDLNTFNYNLQYHFSEQHSWRTSIGVNGMQQTNKNKGIEFLIPGYSLFDIGGFLYTQKRIDQLTLSGGVRLDNRSIDSKALMVGPDLKFAALKKNFSNFSASAGLTYEASDRVNLKFNIARGFRAPGIPELLSNGAHEGTIRFEYGEPNLKSETSFQADAGLELATEHVTLNGNIFYNAIRHFIYYRKLQSVGGGDSIIVDGSEQFFAFRFDQNNARLFGGELNLDIHPHPLDWLHFENTFSYVRGLLDVEQDGSKNLPFIPAARLVNDIKADFWKKGKLLRNGFIRFELDNIFAQKEPFTGFNTETTTPGYSLLDFAMGTDVMSKSGKAVFNLMFAVNNLTDVAYQNHLSRLKYAPVNNVTGRQGVFNMGRNFSFKLNVPLEFGKKQ